MEKRMKLWATGVCLLACLAACGPEEEKTQSGIFRSDFRETVDGRETDLYVLSNGRGMEVCVTNYGARVVSLMAPGRNDEWIDVVCGFPTLDDYLSSPQDFGATMGRYAGCITGASFTLDAVTYRLQANKGGNAVHGGDPGFADKVWTCEESGPDFVRLGYLSPDGENGFPGNLKLVLTYRLTQDNALELSYEATADAPTVVNFSNHSFFNLSGDFTKSVEGHWMWLDADSITPYGSGKEVAGTFAAVNGTPFDFTTSCLIGGRIHSPDPQLEAVNGYDHTWKLNTCGDDTRMAAYYYDPRSGRSVQIFTTEPGVHVCTANHFDGKLVGKGDVAYPFRSAVCFETMHFDDSPHHSRFPTTVLRPGETFRSHTVYRFGVD